MSTRERKVITVLFADLVGFTARSEQLDPEDVEATLRPYHERLRYELERWGGTVEKFIGDAVMALFGAPVSREDDPERAVRAALAIRDWIAEEGELQVRIAVNTGEALVNLKARPEAGEGMAAGDVVNTAARLQSAAPVNGILVGKTTYRATAETIEFREHDAIDAKGKEQPIPVWEVVEARARFGVDLVPEARTELVGREREVEQLIGTLERARRQRSPELITLIGVPGIGKSRLVGELFGSIERGGELTYWRQGRSLPYGQGISYWALAEMVKAQAGILETDSDEDVAAKLERAVEQLVDEDSEWVLSHLRPLAGQAGDAAGSQEEAFAAWRRFFEGLAEDRPLVLVFEDIQWADDGLLDFIEHLADWMHDVPVLIICTARLELLERRPAWGGGSSTLAMSRSPRSTGEETAKLIAALSDRPLLRPARRPSSSIAQAEIRSTQSSTCRMLAERGDDGGTPRVGAGDYRGASRRAGAGGEIRAAGRGCDRQGLLARRPRRRRRAVARVTAEGVRPARASQLGRRRDGILSSTCWFVTWRTGRFRAPTVRRSTCAPPSGSSRLGRAEDHAEMVAHHYSNAIKLARAAGGADDGLATRTRAALREAGVRAASLNAPAQAERYFAEALELAPEDGERLQLLFKLGEAKYLRAWEGGEELEEDGQASSRPAIPKRRRRPRSCSRT